MGHEIETIKQIIHLTVSPVLLQHTKTNNNITITITIFPSAPVFCTSGSGPHREPVDSQE